MESELTFFDLGKTPLRIDKPIRLIELFAGIGAQAKALENLGADFEHYRAIEFDKYAMASYNAIHGTNFSVKNILEAHAEDLGIDDDSYCYIMTYSFPCTDLSLAGKGAGMAKGSGTRSGLLWEVERILKECDKLPDILVMENVPQVHGKKNMDDFLKWINVLDSLGYTSVWKDMNAKDYGIPQNRNRCFMVSWLGEHTYRFPEPIPLTKVLKDYLDEEVDEKYYLKDEAVQKLMRNLDARGWERLENAVDDEETWNSIIEEYLPNSEDASEAN